MPAYGARVRKPKGTRRRSTMDRPLQNPYKTAKLPLWYEIENPGAPRRSPHVDGEPDAWCGSPCGGRMLPMFQWTDRVMRMQCMRCDRVQQDWSRPIRLNELRALLYGFLPDDVAGLIELSEEA